MAWRNLGADERECQFNPRRKGPDFEAREAKNARLSAEIRRRLAGHLDLADGETPLQKVDLFPTQPRGKGPAQIFRDLILRARSDEPFRSPRPSRARHPGRRAGRSRRRPGRLDPRLVRYWPPAHQSHQRLMPMEAVCASH